MDTTVKGDAVPEPGATAPEPAAAVITIDGPNDWLAAAAGDRRRNPGRAVTRNRPVQVDRALRFLWDRAHTGDEATPRRAAAIVNALPGAPRSERILGIRTADVSPPDLPPEARELLAGLGVDVPGPVIEPTAVTGRAERRRHAKKAAAEPAEDGADAEAAS